MRKKYPIQFEVKIEGLAAEGKAITHIDQKVCFVPFAAPGDVVDLQITNKRKQFLEAKVVKYHKFSEIRRKPLCEHFGVCGGCKWQHLPYDLQLAHKQQTTIDHLQRIGHLELPEITPIFNSENEFLYRNKLEYTFSNRRWRTADEMVTGDGYQVSGELLATSNTRYQTPDTGHLALGFHIPGMFDKVLDINFCHLQNEPSNVIRLFVKKYALEHNLSFYDVKSHNGFLRNLMIRNTTTGNWMVVVVFANNNETAINSLMSAIRQEFPQITSLMYVVNEKLNDTIHDLNVQLFHGEPFITEKMPAYKDGQPPLTFRIGAKSFYQTNSVQAGNLYRIGADFLNFRGDEIVYDLYTGAGTIAQYIAKSVKKVVGIEYVESAINDAEINAKLNHIENTAFFAGDIVNVLNDDFVNAHGKPDVIITDPSRAGMHEKVVKQILKINPDKILYISCKSATQARDLALMKEAYKITNVRAVDMFPQTHHVENVVLLEKRT
ncbi:MAG: 23S rRNA (uracil(1939)-C(5))-methyltransferase RlmD [Bacteroidales bacterium]|jgi:23S rRNA (uracil1939-C5)-methyltransferase|nr:23S rRNA (uracil(1939)-C(5))-methyltransferase RlmD [Bacteroidales bacterium]